mgnify:CR=1 FL=1
MRAEQLGANTSCLSDRSLEEATDEIRRLGFRCATLLGFAGTRHRYGELAGFWFHDLRPDEREQLKALVSGFDRLAIHAPFADLPLFSYDPRVEELSRYRVRESIDAAAYLGAEVVIVHANRRANTPIQSYWDHMAATFRSLGEYAVERGVRIGVESGYPDSIDQFVDLLEAVGHHGVGAILDCGHLTRYVDSALWATSEGARELNDRLIEMTRQLGPTIVHCHIHDVRASDWKDHQPVGTGIIDFRAFLAELHSLDYKGILELELEVEQSQQVDALVRSRRSVEWLISRLRRRRQAA